MTKDLIIITLILVVIYLYYQPKQNSNSYSPEEVQEIRRVNKTFAAFCKDEIGGQDINEIRTKLNGKKLTEILQENEDYELEVDTLRRSKGELEADLLAQSNSFKSLIKEKEGVIKRLEQEKKELKEWSKKELEKLNKQLKEKKGD